MMNIVRATPDDARAVAEIHIDAWRTAYADILPADYLATLSVERRAVAWAESLAKGEAELLVAKEAEVVLGWISFGPSRDDDRKEGEAEVWALYVSPSAWSTGVGRALWLDACQRMIAAGFTSCILWVFTQNDRGIAFYRAVGFARDATPPKTFELGGATMEEVRLVTRLA